MKPSLVDIIIDNLYKAALEKGQNAKLIDSRTSLEEFMKRDISEIYDILNRDLGKE